MKHGDVTFPPPVDLKDNFSTLPVVEALSRSSYSKLLVEALIRFSYSILLFEALIRSSYSKLLLFGHLSAPAPPRRGAAH